MYRHYYESINGGEPACIDEQIPFDISDSWEWVRLENLCSYIQRGKSPKYSPIKKYPVIAQKCNQWAGFSIDKAQFIAPETLSSYAEERILQDYDLLWNSTGLGTLGRMAVYEAKKNPYELAVADSHVTVIRPLRDYVTSLYLFYYFANPSVQSVIEEQSDGSTKQKELSLSTVKEYLVPLPPTAEQLRIEQVIRQVSPAIGDYDIVEQKLSELNESLPASLKKSILQHAIQGKLVPQAPNDEPASVLLERIAEERAKLGKKAAKSMSRIERRDRGTFLIYDDGSETDITEDLPFEIPETWAWARLGEIGLWGAGATPSRTHPEYYQGDIPWLKTGDLTDGYITSIPESISAVALEKTSVKLNPVGSVLMAMYGATIGKLGILTFPATTNQACCACVPFSGIFNLYVFYYLMAQRTSFIKQGEGGAQPNISKEKIVNSFIAIPPTREQERIVEALSKTFSIMQA
ncbi:MAG: restriction endonuclease subunit S [Akkermansia sp.]|nr:restriction endonuclease subunit S [Akkermansia sp.]